MHGLCDLQRNSWYEWVVRFADKQLISNGWMNCKINSWSAWVEWNAKQTGWPVRLRAEILHHSSLKANLHPTHSWPCPPVLFFRHSFVKYGINFCWHCGQENHAKFLLQILNILLQNITSNHFAYQLKTFRGKKFLWKSHSFKMLQQHYWCRVKCGERNV